MQAMSHDLYRWHGKMDVNWLSVVEVTAGLKGIVLDLASMKDLQINIEAKTAWAETDLTAGEFTAAVGKHGHR
jgi:hypothetical protein